MIAIDKKAAAMRETDCLSHSSFVFKVYLNGFTYMEDIDQSGLFNIASTLIDLYEVP